MHVHQQAIITKCAVKQFQLVNYKSTHNQVMFGNGNNRGLHNHKRWHLAKHTTDSWHIFTVQSVINISGNLDSRPLHTSWWGPLLKAVKWSTMRKPKLQAGISAHGCEIQEYQTRIPHNGSRKVKTKHHRQLWIYLINKGYFPSTYIIH